MKTMRNFLTALIMVLCLGAKAQTFTDTYADYNVYKTTGTWCKEAVGIMQVESGSCYDSYWHSTLTIEKNKEIFTYFLYAVQERQKELDSICDVNGISDKREEIAEIASKKCAAKHIVRLSDVYTQEFTYGVNISAVYSRIKGKTFVTLYFTSNNNFISSVRLSLNAQQLDDFIKIIAMQ